MVGTVTHWRACALCKEGALLQLPLLLSCESAGPVIRQLLIIPSALRSFYLQK